MKVVRQLETVEFLKSWFDFLVFIRDFLCLSYSLSQPCIYENTLRRSAGFFGVV